MMAAIEATNYVGVLLGLWLKASLILAAGIWLHSRLRAYSARAARSVSIATFVALAAVPLSTLLPPFAGYALLPDRRLFGLNNFGSGTKLFQLPNLGTAWPDLIYLVWAGGSAFCLASISWGLLRLRKYGRDVPHSWPNLINELRPSRLSFRYGPMGTPATFGLWRPVIVLPTSAEQWSDERMRLVLLHEQTHVRQRDWAVYVAGRTISALYWFNPLVHSALRQLRDSQELACDQEVLAQGVDAAAYAELLVGTYCAPVRTATSLGMTTLHARLSLEQRLDGILAGNDASCARWSAWPLLATFMMGCIAVMGFDPWGCT